MMITTSDIVEHPDKSGRMITRAEADAWTEKNIPAAEIEREKRLNPPPKKIDIVTTGELEDHPEQANVSISKAEKKRLERERIKAEKAKAKSERE